MMRNSSSPNPLFRNIKSRGRPEWIERANCKDKTPGTFYDDLTLPFRTEYALSICEDCPVSFSCLTFALENREEGIWGCTTEDERKEALAAGITNARDYRSRMPQDTPRPQWVPSYLEEAAEA